MKGTNTMATARKTKPKGSWSAANAYRPKGSRRKWTVEMQQLLIDEVREADRRGTARQAVYDRLAEQWSKEFPDENYTPHQVSSQFHLAKTRLGYDVVKQAQGGVRVRRVTKPPTRKTRSKAVLVPEESLGIAGLASTIGELAERMTGKLLQVIEDLAERVDVAERERDEARSALEKVEKALH